MSGSYHWSDLQDSRQRASAWDGINAQLICNEGLPEFVGEDPIGRIIKAERFFNEQKIHPSDKEQWAFMRMKGVAMLWFQSWCQENLHADKEVMLNPTKNSKYARQREKL